MLPASLADNAQQHQFTWMHVRIAVVGLVRILGRIVAVHVVRHGAPVDHEESRNVRLGRHVHATSAGSGGLFFRLPVDPGIHLGELEQVLAVVAGLRMVIRCCRQPEVSFTPVCLGR